MHKKRLILLIAFSLLLIVLGSFIAWYFFSLSQKTENTEDSLDTTIKLDKPISILLLGADSLIPGKLKSWRGRSDFIALLYINPFTSKASILSIPRDTKIKLKKYDFTKINSANQFGGYKLAKRSVQRLLGLKIQHVFVFSIQAATELIDALGQFKIFVPQKMSYHDYSAGLHIEIEPGLQVMNGSQLMKFLRYRSKNKGDIGRIERQQIFFRAAIKKIKEPEFIFKLPSILARADKLFVTDMKFAEMFELGKLLRSIAPKDYKSYIVPGDFGANGHWLVDKAELQFVMQEITNEE